MASLLPILGKCFAIRITLAWNAIADSVIQILASQSEGMVVVEHDEVGKRPHLHIALYNAKITHDALRRQLVAGLKEGHPDISGGNALLSVKKWNCQEKYLIYMFKGSNDPTYNHISNHPNPLDDCILSEDEVVRLQTLWKSKCVEENEYSAWKASEHFPKLTAKASKATDQNTEMYYNFDDIVNSARAYSVRETIFCNGKTRYVATNLISNFCMFHKIKMLPYRI